MAAFTCRASASEIHRGIYQFTNLDGPSPGKHRVIVNLEMEGVTSAACATPNALPVMSWETEVIVPDKRTAIQHLKWTTTGAS